MSTEEQKSFRDKVSTIDDEGKRVWIFPKKPKGSFYKARTWVSFILLAILLGTPFLKINGRPFLLLNIIERKFIIFGVGFWPQDFHLFVLATLALVVFVVLFTVTYGRLFCGWACPQTIYMEMVFRKIEYWIDGDAREQKALREAPWTGQKIFKRVLKHGLFFGFSFLLGNVLLAYFIGIEQLKEIITSPPSAHLTGFIIMLLVSGFIYWIYAFFREQICTMVCPYGRLQGVLLDQKSIVVHYDFIRGEPRGKSAREESAKGDCIDCHLCVDVCPTGIDIRNGTQLECINCTACIDACNEVMIRVKKPKGLIRYASYDSIARGIKHAFTPRMAFYSVFLGLILFVLTFLLFTRVPLEAVVLRTPGVLYQEPEPGIISNLYNIKVINKTFEKKNISLRLAGSAGRIEMVGGPINISEGGMTETAFFIKLPKTELHLVNTPVLIDIFDEHDQQIDRIHTSFIGPDTRLK